MVSRIPLLQNVRVAAPCSESWDDMLSVDGDRVHHCVGCKMNVYNLSAMTQSEAEGLLRRHEGRLCVRYYQRRDGTVMTRNCPVGAHAARLMLIRRSVAAAALFALSGTLLYSSPSRPLMGDIGGEVTMGTPVPVQARPTMGIVAPLPVEHPVMGQAKLATMGQAVIPIRKSSQMIQGEVAPRVDVTFGFTDHSKDIPDVPVSETDEKPQQP